MSDPRKGIRVPLSPARKMVGELLYHARKVPSLPLSRLLHVGGWRIRMGQTPGKLQVNHAAQKRRFSRGQQMQRLLQLRYCGVMLAPRGGNARSREVRFSA